MIKRIAKDLRKLRNRHLLVVDLLLAIATYSLMIAFVFPLGIFKSLFFGGLHMVIGTALIHCICLVIFSIYNTDWINASHKDYINLLTACSVGALVAVIISEIIGCEVFFLKFNIVANLAIAALLCGFRFAIRLIYRAAIEYTSDKGNRILIIGAGRLSVMLMRDILENDRLNYKIVGLIDDDETKKKKRLYGTRVIGGRNDIIRLCDELDIDEIIFAIYSIDPKEKSEILEICAKTGKKVKILPGVEASLTGTKQLQKIREINIEDLLNRDPIHLDNELIESNILDKVVLVTGGGGSIGSELCRQIIKYKPKRLIILDIYENTTYELQNELEETYPHQLIDVLIASVRDKKRLNEIFETYKPDIVFHAAAHKHVPLMEFSPAESIKNNVFGTYNTALCACEYGVKRFVMISTDKAVNPTNIMGASKRMCEMIVQTLQKLNKTEFLAVRFGNVLGSHGSVVPRFTKQIEAGGPVTVTHPEITRFFMTIPEAAQLVLQAASYAKGGEIFVLDMGQPVKIYDLAKKMINLSGFKPDVDIKIEFTGLRAGEKLYEELLMNEEGLLKTSHTKIFVGQPIDISMQELENKLNILNQALNTENADIKQAMAQVVPTYMYNNTKKEEATDKVGAPI